jgi:glutathione S-transferase
LRRRRRHPQFPLLREHIQIPERKRAIEDQKKAKQYQAWQTIGLAYGKPGDVGRSRALNDLNADAVPLDGLPGHPLVVPRIRNYLEKELHLDEAARNRWLAHWTLKALEAVEAHLAGERETGRFCHGDAPTIADICLASQVIGAKYYFNCDTTGVPAVMRVFGECMKIEAFDRSQPSRQPDAPAGAGH